MPFLTNNLFLIHIPKTGGTSIERQFGINFDAWCDYNVDIMFGQKNNIDTPLQHLSYNKLCDNIKPNELKFVTIVRNPYDRLVSEFHNQFNQCGNDFVVEKFEWFVDGFLKINSEFLGHRPTQYSFLDGIYGCDNLKVFKFETLSQDFKDYFGFDLKFHEKKV